MKKKRLAEMRKGLQFILLPATILLLVGGCASLFGDKHVAQGKKLFSRYCTPCHGTGGAADGYNAKNLDPHARDLTDAKEDYMAKLSNAEIYEVIEKGGRGVDLAPSMPAWGGMFSEEELWSLVAYTRTLHSHKSQAVDFKKPYQTSRPKHPAIKETDFDAMVASKVADNGVRDELVQKGEDLFGEFGCIGCHKVGKGGGTLGPDLTRVGFMLQPQFIYRWVKNPQSFKPNTRMPNLGLADEEALAVTLYLSTLKGTVVVKAKDSL